MANARAPFALAGLVLLAGSLVMLFFIVLSGVVKTTPLDKTYFLQADTSGIDGARDVSRWTYFYICGDSNEDCGKATPALPFGKAWDRDAEQAPGELIGKYGGGTTSHYYWYMWRFGWVFFLLTLFFDTLAFFGSFLACCGRLGSAVSGLLAAVALLFSTISCTLMTVTFVKARDAFNRDERDAKVGTYAFGFAWGSWAALLLATVLFCIGVRGDKGHHSRGSRFRFGRKRSTRSYDGRRVKDEYS